jgi:hypothetical protein
MLAQVRLANLQDKRHLESLGVRRRHKSKTNFIKIKYEYVNFTDMGFKKA